MGGKTNTDSYYQRTGVDVRRLLSVTFRILTVLMLFSGMFGLLQAPSFPSALRSPCSMTLLRRVNLCCIRDPVESKSICSAYPRFSWVSRFSWRCFLSGIVAAKVRSNVKGGHSNRFWLGWAIPVRVVTRVVKK